MKPIIVDMKDMSDSAEVYDARPNPFLVYFIYILLLLVGVAVGWMFFSKIDIVVKSNGMFRSEEVALEVSSSVCGIIEEWNITEGQYVEKGEVLFSVDVESLEATIEDNKKLLEEVEQRIEILHAYDSYLNGEKNALDAYSENQYYAEFAGRKQLLELGSENADTDKATQKSQYQKELENVAQLIGQYEHQVGKLRQVQECVKTRNNIFDVSESYYESIVSSYISNYNVTASPYDSQITEYEEQIGELQKQIEDAEKQKDVKAPEKEETKQESSETTVDVQTEMPVVVDVKALKEQVTELENCITKMSDEKATALSNLELQQLATIEQQIEVVNSNIISVKSNQTSLQAQLDTLNSVGMGNTEEINELTEKQNVATELANYEAKKAEYENALKQYDLESGNARMTAEGAGYIYLNQELKEGSYITQGTSVCQILPETTSGYYAEIYVENGDIAKLKEGQEVKFEIPAYPSSEYGYFIGVIDSISKDIKVEQNTGSAFYLVKAKCNQATVTNKEGKVGEIKNGMACQAKIVVDEEKVLRHVLQKMDFMD